ncbi:MAG: grasp-with-spasm system SPASM domain peptide maturase [Chitinophagaceae bacterium]|nr:grasp-with-spasm system SPASM domain peptide maturase [Chitinophagaceae bacterium]
MNKPYFKLFSNCLPVKGYTQSIIYDLQFGRIEYIPNLLFDILKHLPSKTIVKIKDLYEQEYNEGIDNYFKHLANSEFGFYTDSPQMFPDIDLTWDNPFEITNLVIDNCFDLILDSKLNVSVDDLTLIIRKNAEEVCYKLESINKKIRSQSLQIFLPYHESLLDIIFDSLSSFNKVKQLIIYEAPEHSLHQKGAIQIISTKNKIEFAHNRSNVHPNYFTQNITLYTEAQNYHTYFNRKAFIDMNGNIKISPEHADLIGNINELNANIDIMDIINKSNFKVLWNIKKDDTLVCKDCEFRYMCIDTRIPIKLSDRFWSHEVDCNYNPLLGKWKWEDGYKNVTDLSINLTD